MTRLLKRSGSGSVRWYHPIFWVFWMTGNTPYYLLSPRQVSLSRISSNLKRHARFRFIVRGKVRDVRGQRILEADSLIDCFESRCRVPRSARRRKESVVFGVKLTVRFFKYKYIYPACLTLVRWKFIWNFLYLFTKKNSISQCLKKLIFIKLVTILISSPHLGNKS